MAVHATIALIGWRASSGRCLFKCFTIFIHLKFTEEDGLSEEELPLHCTEMFPYTFPIIQKYYYKVHAIAHREFSKKLKKKRNCDVTNAEEQDRDQCISH